MEIKQPAELSHVLTMTHRNLLKMWHNPDNVSDVVIQPIILPYYSVTCLVGPLRAVSRPIYQC